MRFLKVVFWILGLAALSVAALFGINATDEQLSELAKKSMVPPISPPATLGNAFTDVAILAELPLEDRLQTACDKAGGRCLKNATDHPELVALAAKEDRFAKRYREMRAKPEFEEFFEMRGPDDAVFSFQFLIHGQHRAHLIAADRANRGELRGAVEELEAENRFHRRVAAGSRSLICKSVAHSMLALDASLASELARVRGPAATAMLERLEAIVRPLTDAEADMTRPLRARVAENLSWMSERANVRLSEETYRVYKNYLEGSYTRPWWDPVAPYLYRPNQNMNRFAAQAEILMQVASVPSFNYMDAAGRARKQAGALNPKGMAALLISPATRNHPYFELVPDDPKREDEITPYIGRPYGLQGFNSLVALQIQLRRPGATSLASIANAEKGRIFAAHPQPFTGKPMMFDAKSRTIGFDAPPRMAAVMESLRKRYGRIGVEVFVDH